jgi:hypothetical protein
MSLVEYVKKNKKEIKGSPKHPLIYLSIYFIIIIFLIPILGFTNCHMKTKALATVITSFCQRNTYWHLFTTKE